MLQNQEKEVMSKVEENVKKNETSKTESNNSESKQSFIQPNENSSELKFQNTAIKKKVEIFSLNTDYEKQLIRAKSKKLKNTLAMAESIIKINVNEVNNSSKDNSELISENGNFKTGRWQPEEHQRFIEAIMKYGNEWKKVQKYVGSRSSTQARSHAQKFFVKIKRTNLLDFNIDLKKNSIKDLHEAANQMNSDEYLSTIKKLNNIAFEKKSGEKTRKLTMNDSASENEKDSKIRHRKINKNPEMPSNIKIVSNNSNEGDLKLNYNKPSFDHNKNIIINNNYNSYNILINPDSGTDISKYSNINTINASLFNNNLTMRKRSRLDSFDNIFNLDIGGKESTPKFKIEEEFHNNFIHHDLLEENMNVVFDDCFNINSFVVANKKKEEENSDLFNI